MNKEQETEAQAYKKPYYEYMTEAEKAISFLEYLGGKANPFNPYNETIARLEGFVSGVRMVERNLDLCRKQQNENRRDQ